jgi:prepilin-type N-terminal cleavage/methylation domain-containing protein
MAAARAPELPSQLRSSRHRDSHGTCRPSSGGTQRRHAPLALKTSTARDDHQAMAHLRLSSACRLMRARLREEHGYTLFELLTVVAIMGFV